MSDEPNRYLLAAFGLFIVAADFSLLGVIGMWKGMDAPSIVTAFTMGTAALVGLVFAYRAHSKARREDDRAFREWLLLTSKQPAEHCK